MSTREDRQKEEAKQKRREEARRAARIIAAVYIEAHRTKKGKK